MNEQDFIAFLWRTGHFWNPTCLNANNVTEGQLVSLTLADVAVREAVQSYQLSDANMLPLVVRHHARLPAYDGVAGPATEELTTLQRCPMPDYPPPPNASFHYDDPDLQKAVESMQAQGSGSWPPAGCDPQRTGIHSIRVGIDTSRAPVKIKAYLPEALGHVSAAYAEIGLAVRYVLDGSKAEIVKRFEPLAGSVIGWNEFPQRGVCNQTVNGRLDTNFQPDMGLWANLECHETGHGVALEHTRGGIMNPSILLVWPLTWKNDPSFATLKRYFGGEPLAGLTFSYGLGDEQF